MLLYTPILKYNYNLDPNPQNTDNTPNAIHNLTTQPNPHKPLHNPNPNSAPNFTSDHATYFISDTICLPPISLFPMPTLNQQIVSKMPTTYFGEMALVENQPRSASVYASDTGDIRVAFLERESFERLLGPCLDIMKRNMATYETTVSDA